VHSTVKTTRKGESREIDHAVWIIMAPSVRKQAGAAAAATKHHKTRASGVAGKENSKNEKEKKAAPYKRAASIETFQNPEKPPPSPTKMAVVEFEGKAVSIETTTANQLRIRWPFAKHKDSTTAGFSPPLRFFPPVLHTDVKYGAGIRLLDATIQEKHGTPTTTRLNVSNNYYQTTTASYSSSTAAAVPILNAQQADLWTHKFSATAALHWQFPASVNRLLGTITRTIAVPAGTPRPTPKSQQKQRGTKLKSPPERLTAIPLTQARKRAEAEVRAGQIPVHEIKGRVADIQHAWSTMLLQQQSQPSGWDDHGCLQHSAVNDPDYVPAYDLRRWLKRLLHASTTDAAITELVEILKACRDLSDPSHLWNIPLIAVYPVVTATISNDRASKKRKLSSSTISCTTQETCYYSIQLAVYCHRLLPETTTTTLGVILRALDADSYVVTLPRLTLHTPATPTFCSSPYPFVCLHTGRRSKDSSIANDNEKKMPAKNTTKPAATTKTLAKKTRDEWMDDDNDTTKDRDDSRVSAFTTTGLLKLLENCGTDCSNYAESIAPHLSGSLQMPLMLHQQHAVLWMVQMEHLSGFGLNSLLWEEREFLDGGKYYVSTALGQLRLDAPETMKGGLLCDEMGLGESVKLVHRTCDHISLLLVCHRCLDCVSPNRHSFANLQGKQSKFSASFGHPCGPETRSRG
jgi:SNF2-related domain